MATRMQQRRGTAAQWISTNSGNGPILSPGEIGFESDTNKFKIGDGVNHWVDLTYFTDAASAIASISDLVDGAPDLLNTLNELAAALGDDPTFFTTVATNLSNHESDTTNVHGIADTSLLATQEYVDTAVGGVTTDITTMAGVGLDYNPLTEKFDIDSTVATKTYADDAVSTHSSNTTSVHGISDTAELATKAFTASLLTNATKSNIVITGDKNGLTITAENGVADSTTDNLTEGSANKYFTNQRALDATAAAYDVAGAALAAQTAAEGYTDTAIGNLVDGAPALLDTLNEIAAAINDDAGIADTLTTAIGTKVSKAGDVMTGSLTLSGAPISNLHAATKAYVDTTAETAQNNAEDYADGLAVNYDANGAADAAETAANLYTDGEILTEVSNRNSAISSAINALTTSDIEEGSNLYFTDERAQDAVGNSLGTGFIYNDSTNAIGVNSGEMINKVIDAVSGNSYGIVGNATYLEVDNTNGYHKEIDVNISALESKLDTDGYLTTSSTSTLTNKTLTSPKINENVEITATSTELNTLDGITASTAELNILDGATLSTTELNYVDGVTSAIQDQLDDKAPLASPTFTGSAVFDDLEIGGALTFSGTATQIDQTNLTISDPLIYLAEGNTANINDLGFVASMNDGTYQHVGLVRDSSANIWKLFKGVIDEPTNTVNFVQGSLDNLAVNTLTGNITGDVTGNVSGNAGTVTNGVYTTDTATVTNTMLSGSIANNKLSNSKVTIGSTDVSLGATATTLAGLSSVTSTSFVGALTGNASTVTNGVYTTDTGTVTNTMLAGSIANDKLSNSSISINGTSVSLGGSISGLATLSSPALTGTPTAPTQSAGDNSTRIATTAYADASAAAAAAAIVASAPSTLDTLNELAAALGNDANYATTITTALGNKQGKVTGVSDTEISYLDGVTSAIQTQLDTKASTTYVDTAIGNAAVDQSALAGNGLQWGAISEQFEIDSSIVTTLNGTQTLTNKTIGATDTITVTLDTATTLDTLSLSSFTTAKYVVSIKQGSKVRSSEVLVHTDGTSVDSSEFGIMEMGGSMTGINVIASVSSTDSILTVTITDASTTNATVKITKTVV